ncbi:MAG: CbiX/SirB N-terminal domain-containing protein [bacterium]|nr:CbiX/SirB N-terminal domain-containing protein [bacterium]
MQNTNNKRALLLVDHGSLRPAANESIESIANFLRELSPELIVHTAHMELAAPDIPAGIARCVADGAGEIIVHPYMLSAGRHATEDIPRIVEENAPEFPQIKFRVTPPLGIHHKLAEVVLERSGL